MANPEHLSILEQGVEAWNQWRNDNPDVQPDLSDADIKKADLTEANLTDANLIEANLIEANLSSANLSGADLGYAKLRRTNLSRATLDSTRLLRADLSGADFKKANLRGTDLRRANLFRADLKAANLKGANLRGASLIDTKLDGATLTNARFWETQRSGWSIKGVICESVYWDRGKKEKTCYSPGEFERLFAEKTRIRLLYKEGINPLEIATLPALIKHLEESHPGCSLRLASIRDDAGGAVVELTIEETGPENGKQLKAALETEAQQKVEYQRQALAERDIRLLAEGALKQANETIDKLISRPRGDIYIVPGQAGAVGPGSHMQDSNFDQAAAKNDERK